MAITSLTSPTVRPPSSLDMQTEMPALPSGQSLAPDQQGLESDLISFGRGALATPSRYDTSLLQSGINLVNSEMEESKKRATASQDEYFSSRGLVGSNVESKDRRDLLSDLERTKSQRLFDLTREMANTFAADRGVAANIGLGIAGYGEGQRQFDTGLSQRESEFSRTLGQSGEQFLASLSEGARQFDTGLGEGARQFDVGAGMNAEQFAASLGLSREQLTESTRQFDQSLSQRESEFSRDYGQTGQQFLMSLQEGARQFDVGTQQAQQQFADSLGLSLQQLSENARQFDLSTQVGQEQFAQSLGLSFDQLQEQARQFNVSTEQQETQFSREFGFAEQQWQQQLGFQREQLAQQLGLSTQELDLQREQMLTEYSDRVQQRLHEADLQSSDQRFAEGQAFLNRELERQALDLQAQGLSLEDAWREADRVLDEQLQTRALDLQQQGLAADIAQQQALLSLQWESNNQQTALSLQDIYLRALAAGAADELPGGVLPFPGGDAWQNYFGSTVPTGPGSGGDGSISGTGGLNFPYDTGTGGGGDALLMYLLQSGAL